jgi:glycine hydroxymethyltransferase
VDVSKLETGQNTLSFLLDKEANAFADAGVAHLGRDKRGRDRYMLVPGAKEAGSVLLYLRAVSDGYVIFDKDDVTKKIEGPVIVEAVHDAADAELKKAIGALQQLRQNAGLPDYSKGRPGAKELAGKFPGLFGLSKHYFAGQSKLAELTPGAAKEEFNWEAPEGQPLKHTALFEQHRRLTKKDFIVPFAGWEMPVWYTRVSEEHSAVRETAGLFDVSHMGLFEIKGPNAEKFLDTVLSNYVAFMRDGQAMYAYCCGPDGNVIDDTFTYRLSRERFWMVVNAVNTEKMWAWLCGVNEHRYLLDREITSRDIEGEAELRNLKDPAAGADRMVNLALQGPMSLDILQSLTDDPATRRSLEILQWATHTWADLAGVRTLVARTGYTGEKVAYEVYVPWDAAPDFWNKLLKNGEDFGLVPCGLGARDSTRTEAGLPLYGHELAGPFNISPIEAGYGAFVKFHKPFFVGRKALLEKEPARKMEIVRWQLLDKDVRTLHTGDPVANKRGKHTGWVTSAVLVEGYQMGLAYVDRRFTEPGTKFELFPLTKPEAAAKEKAKPGLQPGDMLLVSGEAEVLTRWPEEDEEEEFEDIYLPEWLL